ncbi:MAG: hypothetical protein P8X89_06540 [Reinekea sp.]|jgi:pantothenate kinase
MSSNSVTKPSEPWHFSQNVQQMLSVSVAQIKSTLNDGGDSVAELTESFIELAEVLNNLIQHKTDIDCTDLQAIKHKIEQGIIAFQFYDRISQRLDHVSYSLQTMRNLIIDNNKRMSQQEWQSYQAAIKSRFTMESEHQLFTDIISGVPIEQALEAARNCSTLDGGDVELF